MKKLTLIALIFLTSCTPTIKKNKDEVLQEKLKAIWKEHYQESFDTTKPIDILVATNRKLHGKNFGCESQQFGAILNSKTSFGICKINVPKNHSIGTIKLANKHHYSDDFFQTLSHQPIKENDIINIVKKSNRTPLIFVHGFNVEYQKAILTTAEIAYDLKYQGPVILFTWPSGARKGFFGNNLINQTYINNLHNAQKSVADFKNFITTLHDNNIPINLIVHSMGHQIVLPALQEIGADHPKKPVINALILNAPDFNKAKLKQFLPDIKKSSRHITLYCSNNDIALVASKALNGRKRLSACIDSKEIDSINVSLINDKSLKLGHDYYSSKEILTDISQILMGIDAKKRLFIQQSDPFSTEKYFLRR